MEKKSVYLFAAIIFIMALVPRLANLHGHNITADEPTWFSRSEDFVAKMLCGDFLNATEKFECQPGVTSAFLSGISGLALGRIIDPVIAYRLPMALLGALTPLILYLLARRIWSEPVAVAAAIFLALCPFHIALSRVTHMDSTITFFVMVSILSYYLAEKERERNWKYLSAISFGLAFLTKFAALGIVAIIVLWKIAAAFKEGEIKRALRLDRIFDHGDLIWAVTGFATFALFYPKMWPDPAFGFIKHFQTNSTWVGSAGHLIFFLGKIMYQPSKLYYLVMCSVRVTELLFLSFLIGVLIAIWRIHKKDSNPADILILVWFLVTLIILTKSGYMADRYMLPAWPAMCVIASIGLNYSLQGLLTLLKIKAASHKRSCALLAAVILVFNLPALFMSSPNYYLYYNSFVGGTKNAGRWLLIGWGEGHRNAAEYIKRTAGEDKKVAVFGYDSGVSYYYKGEVIDVSASEPLYYFKPDEYKTALVSDEWKTCDYLVIYVNKLQRFPGHPAILYAKAHTPIHTVVLNGVAVAWVYKVSGENIRSN